jgi:hypothetical protein
MAKAKIIDPTPIPLKDLKQEAYILVSINQNDMVLDSSKKKNESRLENQTCSGTKDNKSEKNSCLNSLE